MNEGTGRELKGLRDKGSLSGKVALQGLGLSLELLLPLGVSCSSEDKTSGTKRAGSYGQTDV